MVRTSGAGAPAQVLLASFTRRDRQHVIDAGEEVELDFGKSLYLPGDPITHVYFPSTSYISLITPPGASESLEVGLVGSEGVFGVTVLLDIKDSALQALIQGGGLALRMTTARFRRAANERPAFRRTLNRYLYVLMAQLAQSAACARYHPLDARMARWILMTHDRAHADTFRLTHEFLSHMLGVRRAGVTTTAGTLRRLKLIYYHQGKVTVLDRHGLESASCACYKASNEMYRRRMATHGTGPASGR